MSKVTIIVPIYNVEEYVAKCLDSLLRQTYSDYVIYAVNDGSPKNEQPIIDRYAAAYPEKVVAIRKENGGSGSVLEMAIARLDSEYFLVCDPDDYLADDALETLVGLFRQRRTEVRSSVQHEICDAAAGPGVCKGHAGI